jgi:hypothetical protein
MENEYLEGYIPQEDPEVEDRLTELPEHMLEVKDTPSVIRNTEMSELAHKLNKIFLDYLSSPHPDKVNILKTLSDDVRDMKCDVDEIYSIADRIDALEEVEQCLIISSIVRALDNEMRKAIIRLGDIDPYCPAGLGPGLVNLFTNEFTKYCVLLDELNPDFVFSSMREIIYGEFVKKSGLWHNKSFHLLQKKLNAVYGVPIGDEPSHSCSECVKPKHIRTPPKPKKKK